MSHADLFAQACQLATSYRDRLPSLPLAPRASLASLRGTLGTPLAQQGLPASEVLASLATHAEPGLLHTASPRFFGFVIGGSTPLGVAADLLTSAWGQNAGLYATSPALAVAEESAARWLLELLGLPLTASVGFVTGCQLANFTALAAARHAVLQRHGWDVEEQGLQGAPLVHVVIGEEAHATIPRALRFLGLGHGRALRVPADSQGRMIPSELRRVLDPLTGPVIVCAQAGNVNSGAFDPFDELAPLCAAKGAWLHVDGAFGLWAGASPRLSHLVAGVALADSWATDAHKWLNVPYDSGLVIVKDPAAHKAAMTTDAAYLVKAKEASGAVTSGATGAEGESAPQRDAVDWVPEFSRRARGFTVWAQLRALGRDGVAQLVERCCAQARRAAEGLAREAGAQILNEVVLNQVLARFGPPGPEGDAQTRAVIARAQQEGTCWLGGSVWKGQAVMRVSVSGEATTEEDIDRSVQAIARCVAQG